MKMIFTACTGRCGQHSLTKYFNRFAQGCLAEVEPPNLIYKQKWPLGDRLRLLQRKWIVTHEALGRGKALLWHDNDEREKMEALVGKRLRRVERLCRKHGAHTYMECSKFFIRSYCDETARRVPDLGVLLLRRNPLENARSYVNRNKDFTLDGVMPHFKKACFPIDISKLSKYKLYLWQWAEIELRCQRFVEQHGVRKHFVLHTEDLNNPDKLQAMFEYFALELKEPLAVLSPSNTNVKCGFAPTGVSEEDKREFREFLDMIPPSVMDKIPHIQQYIDKD